MAKWNPSVSLLYSSRAGSRSGSTDVIIFLSIVAAGVREAIDVKVYGRYDEPNLI